MRVLVTGAAGFIGTRVCAALTAAGHEVVAVDAMLTAAHGATSVPPEGVLEVDVRDAAGLASLLPGVDVVCHQAAVVGAGVDATDAPSYGSHNDYGTTVLLAEMFAAGCRRLVLASSMVVYGQGRFECPVHGAVDPLPRTRTDLDAGVFEHRCPVGGEPLEWRLVGEDAPLRPRSLYAASKTAQEHYALAWAEATGGSAVALRYHNVYGPFMPRDTPYSGRRGDLPVGHRKRRAAKGLRGRRADARLRARRRRRCGQRRGGRLGASTGSRRSTSARGGRFRSWRSRPGCARCARRPAPVVTGQYRSGDVRHIVADPAKAADVLGFRAAIDWRDGLGGLRVRPAARVAILALVKPAICEQFGIDFPLFAFSHCRDVVAAVTNAGGFGVLGATAYTPGAARPELSWIDDHVHGKPYGVDIIVPAKFEGKGENLSRAELVDRIPDDYRGVRRRRC